MTALQSATAVTDYTRYVDHKKLAFFAAALAERVPRDGHGLDDGCGRGSVMLPLAAQGYAMVGADVFPASLLRPAGGPSATHQRLQFLLGDAEALPMRDGIFDFVICSEVLEHLHRPRVALAEAFRVLRAGGVLLVTVPNGLGLYDLLFHHLRDGVAHVLPRLRSGAEIGGHVQTFTLSRIRRLIASSGFREVRVQHADFLSWLPLLSRSRAIGRVDCALAERLPSFLVGGYFLCFEKRAMAMERSD